MPPELPPLTEWETFYVIVGSSAAALTGLQFVVIALLAFGATLLGRIPNAALGGVLMFVALRIVRVNQIASICRQSLGEFFLIAVTAAAIIVLNLIADIMLLAVDPTLARRGRGMQRLLGRAS